MKLGIVLTIEDDLMRVARPVELNPEQRGMLELHARARSIPARLVERARIVLRAAEGIQDKQLLASWALRQPKQHDGEIGFWMVG